MKQIGAVSKEGLNSAQNYRFRGIEQMYAAAHPALIANGVFVAPKVIDTKVESYTNDKGRVAHRVMLTIDHVFYAEDGSFVSVVTVGEGLDTSDKASNKAMSAAMKYALIELFCVPTEDVADSDRDTIATESVQPKPMIQKLSTDDIPIGGVSQVKQTAKPITKKGQLNEL